MKIYASINRSQIKLKVNEELLELSLPDDFFDPIEGTESLQMFRNRSVNDQIQKLIDRHLDKLNFLQTIRYSSLRNRTLMLVEPDVYEVLTIGQLYDYVTLNMDSRAVYILLKPPGFHYNQLDELEQLKSSAVNGRENSNLLISELDRFAATKD